MCVSFQGVTAQTRSSFYFCLRHLRASFIVKLDSKHDGFAPHLVCFNLSEVFFRSPAVWSCVVFVVENRCEKQSGGKPSVVGTVTHSMHTSTVTALNLVMCWICAPALGKLLWSFLRGQFVFYCITSWLYNLTIQSSVCHKNEEDLN